MTRVSPCVVWSTNADLPETCRNEALKPAILDAAHAFASDILYNLTRRRWAGECTDTFRPLGCNCSACSGDQRVRALELPVARARAITSVTIDGEVVDPSTYELRDGRYLYRKVAADGVGQTWWPCWNDLHRPAGAVDTWSIVYTFGQDPPPSAVRACAILAFHLALAWTPGCENDCKLPTNVTSMTRGGVTLTFPDPATLFEGGKTHVPEVDMLVAALNRGENQKRAMVAVPGQLPRSSRGAGSIA